MYAKLSKTKYWKKFEEWYEERYGAQVPKIYRPDFDRYVFELFLESVDYKVEKQLWDLSAYEISTMSYKEILDKKFREAWFLRSVLLHQNQYKVLTFNPVDHLGISIPFDSFEQLVEFFFNGMEQI